MVIGGNVPREVFYHSTSQAKLFSQTSILMSGLL